MPGPSLLGSLDLSVFNTEGAPPVEKQSETVVDPPPSTSTPLPGGDVGMKLPGSGKGSQVSDPPFVVGEGLAPVPAKLVTKILRGEYVDMSELLRDNIEAERRQMGLQNGQPPYLAQGRREVPDILSWVQCFGTYASVVISKYPERRHQLIAYLITMVREARRCGGRGWQAYDAMFRQQAAGDTSTDWSKLNSSLYASTFLACANGSGKSCSHCLMTDHTVGECAAAAVSRPGRNLRMPQRGYGGDDRRSGRGRSGACFAWNEGRCSFPYCRYRHQCSKCQGDHRATQCHSAPVVGQEKGVQEPTDRKRES